MRSIYYEKMGSVLMKIVASYAISILLMLQVGALRATSWEMKSFEEIVDGSEVIGIFTDFSFSDEPSDESGFFVIRAEAKVLVIKGRTDQDLTFCARDTKDFYEGFDRYLLFLHSAVVDEQPEGAIGCDYFLRTFEQNAYPIADYSPESRSGEVLIFRASGFDGKIRNYDLHSTLHDIFISVKLATILDAIDEIEEL